MDVSSHNLKVPIVGWWTVLERKQGETGRQLFDRVWEELDRRVQALPVGERYSPLYEDWEELMHD